MKFNFKVNYKALTAAHFSSFPQTEQSQKILSNNQRYLRDVADRTSRQISSQATDKARNHLLGGKFSIFI